MRVAARFMLMDACVLIDYMDGEPDLFKLISSHIGPIYVATPILDEVDSIASIGKLKKLGLIPIKPEPDDGVRAENMAGKTSSPDNVCFLIAKQRELTCVSNDRNLRKKCKASNIPILWGLELILELVKVNGLSKEKASRIAEKIYQSNPQYINMKVLERFRAELDHIRD